MHSCNWVPFSFRITSINSGWLFANLELSGRQVQLENSYLGGLDLPKALVKACCALLSEPTSSQWLCWHGESIAQLWHLQKESDQLYLKMYRIGSSFGLPVCGDPLAQKSQRVAPEVSAVIDPFVFAQSILQAFKEYKLPDAFAQWQSSGFRDHFPEEEYHALRKLLRAKGCR